MRSAEQAAWDLVQEWIGVAEEDLHVAEELMQRERLSYSPVGFHAQQAAEKFIKALLSRFQVAFPKTHKIEELLVLAEKAAPGIYGELREVDALSPYGVEIRYPRRKPPLNREEGARAVQLAGRTKTVIMQRLDDYIRAGRPRTTG